MIVIATKDEIGLVEKLGYKNEPILITGVGGVNVIRALDHLPRDTDILNIGYCGSNILKKDTIVYVDRVHTLHENVEFDEPNNFANGTYKLGYKCCDCYTSTDFVVETKIQEPCVFDMELAFIRAMFPKARAIKVVSDNLDVDAYERYTLEKLKKEK